MRTDEQTERPQVSEQTSVPRWKLLLQIFGTFFKMGCFTFGSGLSILLQVEEEYVEKRKLLTSENVLELTTVGACSWATSLPACSAGFSPSSA